MGDDYQDSDDESGGSSGWWLLGLLALLGLGLAFGSGRSASSGPTGQPPPPDTSRGGRRWLLAVDARGVWAGDTRIVDVASVGAWPSPEELVAWLGVRNGDVAEIDVSNAPGGWTGEFIAALQQAGASVTIEG